MKIERLLSIIIYLLNHKRVSANKLASKYEVSIRTIQRDIDTLTFAGIPITSFKGVEGGYELDEDYQLQVQLASQDDYDIILSGLKAINSAMTNNKIENTLEKVQSIKKGKQQHSIIMDLSVAKEKETININLDAINQSIQIKAVISFDYTNAMGEKSIKQVDPITLIYQWYSWYLIGFDRNKKKYRYFKLIRMENVQQIAGFNQHDDMDISKVLSELNKDKREYYQIEILCKKNCKIKAIEYLNGHIIEVKNNGDYLLSLRLPKSEELWKGTILSFGSQIEIISPKELKEELVTRCEQFLNNNRIMT